MYTATVTTILTCNWFPMIVFFKVLLIIIYFYVITVVPLERSVLIKEHLNNWYTLKAYFIAKSAAEIVFEVKKKQNIKT